MSRQARIVFPGELHHITQRGNYQQTVFYEDMDRAIYLKYINEHAQDYGLDIFAYCLMDNHVHFIVRPQNEEALAKTFRVTHQQYSFYFNKKLHQKGHLWQSRYFSCVVLGSHIERAIRYVEKNPVRANIAGTPWHYLWSSAPAHSGCQNKTIKLADIKEYIEVSSWKRFLNIEDDEKQLELLRNSTYQGKAFGTPDAIQALEKKVKRFMLVRPAGRPPRKK